MARAWLEALSPEQRSLSPRLVQAYAYAMRRDMWHPANGQSALEFDEHGRLRNGQHRLHAIVLAGVPVLLPVETEPRPVS